MDLSGYREYEEFKMVGAVQGEEDYDYQYSDAYGIDDQSFVEKYEKAGKATVIVVCVGVTVAVVVLVVVCAICRKVCGTVIPFISDHLKGKDPNYRIMEGATKKMGWKMGDFRSYERTMRGYKEVAQDAAKAAAQG